MPNCFALSRKNETEYVSLEYVDRVICQRLELEYNPANYVCDWYGSIGFALAVGRTFPELLERYGKRNASTMLRITALLAESFDSHAWAER